MVRQSERANHLLACVDREGASWAPGNDPRFDGIRLNAEGYAVIHQRAMCRLRVIST